MSAIAFRSGQSIPEQAGLDRARRLPDRQHHPGPDDPTRVRAVVDWELSTLGDPLSDAALMCVYRIRRWT